MPFTDWSAGDRIDAADFDSLVQQQVVATFTDSSQRDAQVLSPVEGQFCVLKNTDRVQVHNGSGWLDLYAYNSAGRIGAWVSRGSTQTIPQNTLTTITFDTVVQDPDGWHSGSSFNSLTVPIGMKGIYQILIILTWPSPIVGQQTMAKLTVSGVDYTLPGPAGLDSGAAPDSRFIYTTPFELLPTGTIGLKVAQSYATNLNVLATMDIVRIAI